VWKDLEGAPGVPHVHKKHPVADIVYSMCSVVVVEHIRNVCKIRWRTPPDVSRAASKARKSLHLACFPANASSFSVPRLPLDFQNGCLKDVRKRPN